MSSYLKAIDFFFLFNLMHFSIIIYMVCSYSFELSQKTVRSTFILNFYLILLLVLKLSNNLLFFGVGGGGGGGGVGGGVFFLMHYSIKIYMVCSYPFKLSQKTVPTTFILNYYPIRLLILKL